VDALQALTLGSKRYNLGDAKGAIPYYKHALDLDPNFAYAYTLLASAYRAVGQGDLAASANTKAFEMRSRMEERSRLLAEYDYYAWVTGEREKALSAVLQSVQTFPRTRGPRVDLASCLAFLGQLDKAADEAREAARIWPVAFTFSEWAFHSIDAGRSVKLRAPWTTRPHESSIVTYCKTIAFAWLFYRMTSARCRNSGSRRRAGQIPIGSSC
jgi:eukaryotic-like serine/threonine-protein kinase